MIHLQKPVCPQCGSPAFYTLDSVQALQSIDEVTNSMFRYMHQIQPIPVMDSRTTPRNRNGTITVLCHKKHRWETGMQERAENGIPSPIYLRPDEVAGMSEEALREAKPTTFPEVRSDMDRLSEAGQMLGREIHKLIVLSTAHISKECNDLLEELTAEDSRSAGPGCHSDKYPFGFHITLTPIEEMDPDEQWIDPSLEGAVAYARKLGCTHLRLDCDGPRMKDLPTYEW